MRPRGSAKCAAMGPLLCSQVLPLLLLLAWAGAAPAPASTTTTTTPGDLVAVAAAASGADPRPEAPQVSEQSEQGDQEQGPADEPQLRSMHVQSNVTNRYGRTVISSRYANPHSEARQATFSVVLPETAFITGFVMEIKGVPYEAYVREKEQARREYQAAVSAGQAAAHVELNARDSNRFTVSVNVEPHAKVVFNLTYEQLLVRRHGRYELVLNLRPGQLVKQLSVAVNVNETGRLLNLDAPPLRTGNEVESTPNEKARPDVTIDRSDDGRSAAVLFEPTIKQQKKLSAALAPDAAPKDGPLSGQFVVSYDVERPADGGELLYGDGYFVHFFAPNALQPLPKHVVFVLDLSGSMLGRKVEQLRQAMKHILAELHSDDYFHLVEFSTSVKVWDLDDAAQSFRYESPTRQSWWGQRSDGESSQSQRLPSAAPADPEHIQRAQQIVKEMADWGGTNINDALAVALNLTTAGVPNAPVGMQPVVVFLTDGDATVGETRTGNMLETAAAANKAGASIFALSFGDDANRSFLKQLSLQNGGFSRHIYEAADAALQLQDFYREISSPLLSNVTFRYDRADPETLTRHVFRTLFEGAELVVAGRVKDAADADDVQDASSVHALTRQGPLDFVPHVTFKPVPPPGPRAYGPLERLWAYLSVRQLLDKRDGLADADSKEATALREQALKMALKYSFVTSVTSLVVVKPNETSSVDTEEARPMETPDLFTAQSPVMFSSFLAGGFGASGISGLQGVSRISAMPTLALARPLGLQHSPGPFYVEESLDSDSYDSHDPLIISPHPPRTTTTHRPLTTSIIPSAKYAFPELPWLAPLVADTDSILLDGKYYAIGNNATAIQLTTCTIPSAAGSGNCTLLSMCPQIYPKLNDLPTYRKYFCSLEQDRYAGVCCLTENEEHTTDHDITDTR